MKRKIQKKKKKLWAGGDCLHFKGKQNYGNSIENYWIESRIWKSRKQIMWKKTEKQLRKRVTRKKKSGNLLI